MLFQKVSWTFRVLKTDSDEGETNGYLDKIRDSPGYLGRRVVAGHSVAGL
jgi:hypothetical protein